MPATRAVLSTVTLPVKAIVASRLKQSEPSTCRAQGGGIAICAPHEAHYSTDNTNTKTHDARGNLQNDRMGDLEVPGLFSTI